MKNSGSKKSGSKSGSKKSGSKSGSKKSGSKSGSSKDSGSKSGSNKSNKSGSKKSGSKTVSDCDDPEPDPTPDPTPDPDPCPTGGLQFGLGNEGECNIDPVLDCPFFLSPMANQEYVITDNAKPFTIINDSNPDCILSYTYSVVNPEGGAALSFDPVTLTFEAFYMDDLLLAGDTGT